MPASYPDLTVESSVQIDTNPPKCHCNCEMIAMFLAPQTTDLGKNIAWVPVCGFHLDGWFGGDDWAGPVIPLNHDAMILPGQKCQHTACLSPAICCHQHTGHYYCLRCARKINEANDDDVPDLVAVPMTIHRDDKTRLDLNRQREKAAEAAFVDHEFSALVKDAGGWTVDKDTWTRKVFLEQGDSSRVVTFTVRFRPSGVAEIESTDN